MAPSTFASAAAASSQTPSAARDGGPDWGRRTNGATQTFRRPSGAATMANSTPHPDTPASSQPPRYVPPHRNGTFDSMRYSKDQLLDLFRAQQSIDGGLKDGLPSLYVGGWQPDTTNGTASAGWGRSDHGRDVQPGPDICWDRDGSIEPLGLVDMDDEERELFSNSVNTPIKPPSSVNKDVQQANGLPGRKTSVSNSANTPGGFGLPSPSATRGFGRRRETSESFPFPSPTTNREEQRAASPPPSLLRRRTDLKDGGKSEDRERDGEDKSATTPFGTLKRNPTGPLSAGFGAPSSPWSTAPQSAGMSPMGSFGNFGLGGQPGTTSDKRPGLGSGRAESRFKNLLSKDSNEDMGSPTVQRKGSVSSLSRVNEHESWRPQDHSRAVVPETEEDVPSGSAALAAGSDMSPHAPRQGVRGFGTPSRSGTQDEFGFGAFGMTADTAHGGFGQGFLQGRDAFHQTPSAQRMGQQPGGNEPMSPTDTNPYQSPEQHGIDRLTEDTDTDGSDVHNDHLPGLGGFGQSQAQQLGGLGGLNSFQHLGRGPAGQAPASDRSQTSSVAGSRGFPSLGGLGQLSGVPGSAAWPVTQPGGFGTPSRPTAGLANAFGGGIFASSTAEMQSPGLAGLGGASLLSPQSGGGFGGSRMASMFPPAMQDQMRQGDQRMDERDASQPFGGLGGAPGGIQSPFAGQAQNELPQDLQQHAFGAPGAPPMSDPQHQQDDQSGQQPPSSASNQPPAPQQRTMVMPDRMRWIYRDPQGQTQGPWSGLEMHDWYKAGFFSPELLVKKYEDQDYEPLAQLIRRIGNSREPFLVPQIGIPHGAPSSSGPASWGGAAAVGAGANTAGAPGGVAAPGGPTSSGGAQPPFASSFPSFGTTLTAEQQNALERRKQEEQYLMARQKEHLAQAQIASRMQMPGGGGHHQGAGLMPGAGQGQLHHHSSAQSLHSQPSFGSMTSPSNAFQPSPIQAPSAGGNVPGFFDNSFRSPATAGLGAVGAGVGSLGHIREEEIPGIMDRLSLGDRAAAAGQFGAPGQPFGQQQQAPSQEQHEQHEQQVKQMLQDRARLTQEQEQHDRMQQQRPEEQQVPNERLQQFQQLQGQGQAAQLDARFQPAVGKLGFGAEQQQAPQQSQQTRQAPEPLSLTEQVEAAVSAQQSPVPQQPGLPQPFPPAPSQSPLPAPAAQRTGRQSVADQLQTESRDLSQTPSVETLSAAVAPWAKEPAEAAKGPSLKEIQAAEAKKAAEREALAAAQRRAAFEKEMEAQQQVVAPAPGLPASASWGTAGSPAATPTGSAPAAWAKTAQKPSGSTTKTMAQIQKEEEARKKRLAAAAANAQTTAMSGVAVPAGGKSYANLAGKVSSPAPTAGVGGVWTTVGSSGKPKTPLAPPVPAATRSVSSGMVPPVQSAVRKAPSRTSTLNNAGVMNAQEEFRKWAVGELRPDLNKSISPEDFVATLAELGTDKDMITEAVHGASNTIDSRHFAEEFLRRKKLADKGQIDHTAAPKSASPATVGNGQSGGWSEVAKKGPTKEPSREESNGAFRVVAAKKKGSKR